ncbi:LysR family transcriptional regulator [Jatrophihabitans sp. YIM 134969]
MTDVGDIDLNLLLPLAALLEERHVTRAAERVHLSQPAMSRTLARLRRVFDDELLVRGPAGYEPTPRAERIQRDLRALLPQVRQLFAGGRFDPAAATESHRLSGTDYAVWLFAPSLFRAVLLASPHSQITFTPWHDRVFEDLERGTVDLAFYGLAAPAGLRSQKLFDERFVCLVSDASPLARRRRLDLDTYLAASHVVIDVGEGEQTVIDRHLSTLGRRRAVSLRLPYHAAAPAVLPGTALVATLPKRLADTFAGDPDLRFLAAPPEIAAMTYRMSWHPRLDDDPAHRWLRAQVRAVVGGGGDDPGRSRP